jgi:HSP20 family protein
MTRPPDARPLHEIASVRKRLNDLFESALARWDFDAETPLDAWVPAADAYVEGDRFVVHVELAGVDPRTVELRVVGAELVIEGQREIEHERAGSTFHRIERSYGRFGRRFELPEGFDPGRIEARLRAGVLSIEVPLGGAAQHGAVRVPIG